MNELVSVIVCAYNNWPDLELAIESALCQSHRNVEVIIVDNSSTDATEREVPRRFGDRVQYVRQPNRGDSGAYNTGMTKARGEFIQFLDGDDVLAPNKIEKQLEVFRADPAADVVFGNIRHFQSREGSCDWTDYDVTEEDVTIEGILSREGGCIGIVLSVLFRRRVIERVGSWDETIYVSDSDYELRALLAGCRYRHCPGGPMSFKRIWPGQMGLDRVKMLEGWAAFWIKALTLVKDDAQREGIRLNLARARFARGFRGDGMTTKEAVAKIREARRTCPKAVPVLVYFLALAVVIAPGGRAIATNPRFRPIRRAVASFFGYMVPPSFSRTL